MRHSIQYKIFIPSPKKVNASGGYFQKECKQVDNKLWQYQSDKKYRPSTSKSNNNNNRNRVNFNYVQKTVSTWSCEKHSPVRKSVSVENKKIIKNTNHSLNANWNTTANHHKNNNINSNSHNIFTYLNKVKIQNTASTNTAAQGLQIQDILIKKKRNKC